MKTRKKKQSREKWPPSLTTVMRWGDRPWVSKGHCLTTWSLRSMQKVEVATGEKAGNTAIRPKKRSFYIIVS